VYAGMVSVKEYGPTTHAGQLDGFLQMPCELIISQSFSFTNTNFSRFWLCEHTNSTRWPKR
ncbi:MAG: hypothetical protein EOO43_08790, partial [Flavobacterium sp.]